MALDEFILWVNGKSEYKTAKAYVDAAKAKPDTFKMGGSQSKDTDQTLTSQISAATGAKFLYVPYKSGGEAAVQLAGGHIDSNTNNPSESIGQWKGGLVTPLCVFSPKRLAPGTEGDGDDGLVRHSDVRGIRHPDRPVPAAAHALAAAGRARRCGRVLRRRARARSARRRSGRNTSSAPRRRTAS